MITKKWQRYPAYKDSGVEWLGEIPEHWEVKKLKNAAFLNLDTLNEDIQPDYLLTYIDIGNVTSDGSILETQEFQFKQAPSRARRRVKDGDTIISTVRTYLRAISLIQAPPENLIVSTGFAVLTPSSKIESEYLFRLVQSSEFVEKVVAHSEGVGYPAINPSKLACLPIWLPPLPEQQKIAQFLDRETAKIDNLITKKTRLIELLKEKRTALISHAVTKGLNPDVPMKDSGVEWLGEVPEGWEVKRVKYAFILQRGYDLSSDQLIEGLYPVCASNGVIGFHNKFNVKAPSITVGRSGSVGEINYIENDFWAHNTALFVKEFVNSIPRFIFYILLILDTKRLSAGSAVGTLNRNYIHELLTTLPPISEQQKIAEFLDRETSKIDNLITKTRTSIDYLKEYRTALISAAVTGKIDVREEV